MRLVPPKAREFVVPSDVDSEADAWARGLHKKRRGLAITLLGNAAMLAVLLGVPFLRGQSRARESFAAFARFSSCLLGAKARTPVGLGASPDEPELFGARVLREGPSFHARCATLLDAVPPESAMFVLPSVKDAEERTREATRVMRVELQAIARHAKGEALSDRPLRALSQLRDTVRSQGEAANLVDVPAHATLEHTDVARTARATLFTARDADISLWGDDQALYAVAFDGRGVSYLELLAGRPMRRARLDRPAALRGTWRGKERSLLVWATPEARCRERAHGCYGKTSSLAPLRTPFFYMPEARLVAAHFVGRPDRSFTLSGDLLTFVAANELGGVSIATLALPESTEFGPDLPALTPQIEAESLADVLLVPGDIRPTALASGVRDGTGVVTLREAGTSRELVRFDASEPPWMVMCARPDGFDFAAGTGQALQLGRVSSRGTKLWAPVAMPTREVVDAQTAERDHVKLSCANERGFALVEAADHVLRALACEDNEAACRQVELARDVHRTALLVTGGHVLVAYSGDDAHPQIMLTRLAHPLRASQPEAPAACYVGSRGLCGPPHLARMGTRIVLAGHEGPDLSLLESADEGVHWTTPPVF